MPQLTPRTFTRKKKKHYRGNPPKIAKSCHGLSIPREISPSCTAVSVIFVAQPKNTDGYLSPPANFHSLRKTSVRRDKMLKAHFRHVGLTNKPTLVITPEITPDSPRVECLRPVQPLLIEPKQLFQCPRLQHLHPVRQLRHAVTCPPEVALPHQTAGSLFFQTSLTEIHTKNTQGTLPIARPLRNVGNLHRPSGRQANLFLVIFFYYRRTPHRHRRTKRKTHCKWE